MSSRPLTIGLVGLGIATALAGCASSAGATTSANYQDGTYTENGNYLSPEGNESISVTLTLAANKVTAVTITPHPNSGTAAYYQQQFASGIASEVVGQNIDTLNVSRVAGSSLTSTGFDAALATIKAHAVKP